MVAALLLMRLSAFGFLSGYGIFPNALTSACRLPVVILFGYNVEIDSLTVQR